MHSLPARSYMYECVTLLDRFYPFIRRVAAFIQEGKDFKDHD